MGQGARRRGIEPRSKHQVHIPSPPRLFTPLQIQTKHEKLATMHTFYGSLILTLLLLLSPQPHPSKNPWNQDKCFDRNTHYMQMTKRLRCLLI